MGKRKWGILFFGYVLLCSYDVVTLGFSKCFVPIDLECVNFFYFLTRAATTASYKAGTDVQI